MIRLCQDYVGKMVIIRSRDSGVWFAEFRDAEDTNVLIANARKVWNWKGAGATSGLALTGPVTGNIAPPVPSITVTGVCEVIPASDVAIAAFSKIGNWNPR